MGDEKQILLDHLDELHTTEMGRDRIGRNLNISGADAVASCRQIILDPRCQVYRQGKNWYCVLDQVRLTIHASSYTIITAHMR